MTDAINRLGEPVTMATVSFGKSINLDRTSAMAAPIPLRGALLPESH